MNILVIDIGTTSMRGILFAEDGKILEKHQMKFRTLRKDGVTIEQTPKEWEQFLAEILKTIADRSVKNFISIDGISITAQRSSLIPLNREGKPLMPAIMWQDSRNAEICSRLREKDDIIFERSGAPVNTVFFGGKIAWLKEQRPDIYKQTNKFVTISQYLTWLMTGQFCTDHTYGSRTNLMNLRERCWDPELLKIFGVKEEQLCRLTEPGNICGTMTAAYAGKVRLKSGTPVISAGGDQQCAAVGQGVYRERSLSIVAGTGAFLVSAIERVPEQLDRRLICNCSAVRDHYILEANVLTCCSAFDWYCSSFYDGDQVDYHRINRELQEVYDEDSQCLVLPYFQGKGSAGWEKPMQALFSGVTLSTRRQDLLKALVEGIFMEIRNNIEVFRQYIDIPAAYISGGLTNSAILNQMQADVYGMKLFHMENSEATALGALMVTLTAAGRYASLEEAFSVIRKEDKVNIYIGNEQKSERYQNKRRQMNELYERVVGG